MGVVMARPSRTGAHPLVNCIAGRTSYDPGSTTPAASVTLMLLQFLFGIGMIAITLAINACVIVIGANRLQHAHEWLSRGNLLSRNVVALTLVTVWLVFGLLVIMMMWALALYALGIFDAFEPALYFSMVSFTTLGFGDVVLPTEWRLLSGFIATDGFILFGLNAAFLFEVLRRLREDEVHDHPFLSKSKSPHDIP